MRATTIHTTVQMAASLALTTWECRWKTPRSRASMPKSSRLKRAHIHQDVATAATLSRAGGQKTTSARHNDSAGEGLAPRRLRHLVPGAGPRSEERRVGKECSTGMSP